MNITKLKNINIFLCVTATVFSFPLQVIYQSALPSLLPYIFLGILFLLAYSSKLQTPKIIWNIGKPIILTITIYFLLVFLNTSWQVLFGFISPVQAMSAIFIYLFPVLFFIFPFFCDDSAF